MNWEIFRMIFNPHWIGNLMIHIQMEILESKPNELLQMVSNFGRVYQYYFSLASNRHSYIFEEIAALQVLSKLKNDFLQTNLISVKPDGTIPSKAKIPSMLMTLPLAFTLDYFKGDMKQLESFTININTNGENIFLTNYNLKFLDNTSNLVHQEPKNLQLIIELEKIIKNYIDQQSDVIKNSINFIIKDSNSSSFDFTLEYIEKIW